MIEQIQIRRDTAANWTSANPTLALGEPALETDTGFQKMGDGVTAWNSLAYALTKAGLASTTSAALGQGLVGFNPALSYATGTLPAALASTAAGQGAALVGYQRTETGALGHTLALSEQNRVLDVKVDFGAKGDGVTDDTAAIQSAFNAMVSYAARGLHFPQGTYAVSSTLKLISSLASAKIFGDSGWDGALGFANLGPRTSILWTGGPSVPLSMMVSGNTYNVYNAGSGVNWASIGINWQGTVGAVGSSFQATSVTPTGSGATLFAGPVVQCPNNSGIIWSGISINCNHNALYGIQFLSTTANNASVMNIVEKCNISYAVGDGIILGQELDPAVLASPQGPAPAGSRQFYSYLFERLNLVGNRRCGIHINEYNADMPLFDQVWVAIDDTATFSSLNGFWFERGGNSFEMRQCYDQSATYAASAEGSNYSIKIGSSVASSGCEGGTLLDFWSETNGGLLWAKNSVIWGRPLTFQNCKAFGYGGGSSLAQSAGGGDSIYIYFKSAITAPTNIVNSLIGGNVHFGTIISGLQFQESGNNWGTQLSSIYSSGASQMTAGNSYAITAVGSGVNWSTIGTNWMLGGVPSTAGTLGATFTCAAVPTSGTAGTGGAVMTNPYVVDASNNLLIRGVQIVGGVSGVFSPSPLAKTVLATLSGNVTSIYFNRPNDTGTPITIVFYQPASGGIYSYGVTFGAGQWANNSQIPAPNVGSASIQTTYTAVTDGNFWHVTGRL